MLARLLTAVLTLALLLGGAIVGLEALGAVFQAGVPDAQQRMEAFLDRLAATLDPVDLPEESEEAEPQRSAVVLPPVAVPDDKSDGPPGSLIEADTTRQARIDANVASMAEAGAAARLPARAAPDSKRVAAEGAAVLPVADTRMQGCAGRCKARRRAQRGSRRWLESRAGCPVLKWVEAAFTMPARPAARPIARHAS